MASWKTFSQHYALLATRFPLRTRLGELRETRHYVGIIVQCLQHVLFAYLGFKIFGRVLTRFAARFFEWPFFMLIAFIFSYLEKFFRSVLVIFLFLSSNRAQRARHSCKAQTTNHHYHKGHAWRNPHTVWMQECTPQTTSSQADWLMPAHRRLPNNCAGMSVGSKWD